MKWLSTSLSRQQAVAILPMPGWFMISLIIGVLGFPAAAWAEPVIQGYATDSVLVTGQVVAIADKSNNKVTSATADKLEKMYGVVVDPGAALVTLTKDGEQVFVAASGRYAVLVSDENGSVSAGDFVSLSSAPGIAAKATEKQALVLGKALENLNGRTPVTTTASGAIITRLLVDVQIGKNPNQKTDKNFLPEFLQTAGNRVAGKPVATSRLYAAAGLLIISAGIAVALLYAGVRSSIISIGRNPLGKKGIIRGLLQVVIFGLIVFLMGIFGVYLLLKL